MSLTRWNNKRNVIDLHTEMNNLFDNFFKSTPSFYSKDFNEKWKPLVDVIEEENQYRLITDLAGIEPKDVNLNFDNGYLHVKGERKSANDVNENSFHRRERSYGMFERHVKLPENINSETIKADFKNGQLTVTVEKKENSQRKNIKINT